MDLVQLLLDNRARVIIISLFILLLTAPLGSFFSFSVKMFRDKDRD